MKKHYLKIVAIIAIIILVEAIFILLLLTQGKTIALLEPAGTIARQQKDLMIFASILSLFVIAPVFILLGFILFRYRDGNHKATYKPNWDGSKKLESIWWGLPIAIIIVLAVITYKTSHSLDPYKPLESATAPVTIEAVALQWKWLFIYKDENIATINYLRIPENTPINFKITSDAPMNSLWIPQLGGMVYAMTGMETKLHLMADQKGTYTGQSANISGEGYAGMKFTVDATSKDDFESWVNIAKNGDMQLNNTVYNELRKPSEKNQKVIYASSDPKLYENIIAKYMTHTTKGHY